MRVYLDTGVFLDYLIYRHADYFLRKRGRRGRTVQQLFADVSECLNKINQNAHEGFTSTLTLYEAQEAMYSKLLKLSKGVQDTRWQIISSSRCVVIQIMSILGYYNLSLLALSEDIINWRVQETSLQIKGIGETDSLHIATAIVHCADIIISTDIHFLGHSNIFRNENGILIKCLDTNKAKLLL